MRAPVFLGYDQAELDRQYDQRVWASNAAEIINRYSADSAAARMRLGDPEAYAYGDSRAETFDVFRTHRGKAPIHVFVHGGAWRQLSKLESAFAAENFVRAGAHFVALDFGLLPLVSIDEMAAQVKGAIAAIYRNAAAFDGDADRIFLSGHSSGAHLVGVAITSDWSAEYRLSPDIVKGAVCCSGIYDLEPVRRSARNDYLQLGSRQVELLSPIRNVARLACPVAVAIGEHESDEFKRQARDFAGAIERDGKAVELIEAEGLNHFEIVNTLASPDGVLGRIALHQMGLGLG
jgi:arylformamidase